MKKYFVITTLFSFIVSFLSGFAFKNWSYDRLNYLIEVDTFYTKYLKNVH